MILPLVLKHHTKTNNTSAILKYYGSILPVFTQIESEEHKIMVRLHEFYLPSSFALKVQKVEGMVRVDRDRTLAQECN